MREDKTPLQLRVLCVESFLALSLSVILPIVAKMEGEKANPVTAFPYLFAGLIGISAYEISSRLYKRVVALENQVADQKNDPKGDAELRS